MSERYPGEVEYLRRRLAEAEARSRSVLVTLREDMHHDEQDCTRGYRNGYVCNCPRAERLAEIDAALLALGVTNG